MYALPLFYPTHAHPSPILSHPMHTLPLFYPSPCIPCPLFYPSSCTPSPYCITAYTHPPPILSHSCLILSHPVHVLSRSLPANTCYPSILFQLMHALLTRCHMNLEGMFLLRHLRMPLLNLLTLSISSSFTLLSNLKHQFITPELLLFSFT